MSLFYIKGTPGAGKSAICLELLEHGYEAIDADGSDIGGPYNNATNQRVVYPKSAPSPEWFNEHSWRLIPEQIEALSTRAKNKTIFLCGTADNEDEVWHLFDRVIFLNVDRETIRKRIAGRTENTYGQTPHELKLIMEKFDKDILKRDRPNVIRVDASKPIAEVTQAIIGMST
jgi:adenylate kinase family enzyme